MAVNNKTSLVAAISLPICTVKYRGGLPPSSSQFSNLVSELAPLSDPNTERLFITLARGEHFLYLYECVRPTAPEPSPSDHSVGTALEKIVSFAPPKSLSRTWRREWIKTSREPRTTDVPGQGAIWYLQLSNGLFVDARVDLTGGGEHDCRVGVALWHEDVLNWHPVIEYSAGETRREQEDHSAIGTRDPATEGVCFVEDFETSVQKAVEKAVENPESTPDRGRVEWRDENNGAGATSGGTVWHETDAVKGREVLEERWVALDENNSTTEELYRHRTTADGGYELFLKQGGFFAHVAVYADGRTEYSMGTTDESTGEGGRGKGEIKVSTVLGKIGQNFDWGGWE